MSFVSAFRKLGPPWLLDGGVAESLATTLDTFAARARVDVEDGIAHLPQW